MIHLDKLNMYPTLCPYFLSVNNDDMKDNKVKILRLTNCSFDNIAPCESLRKLLECFDNLKVIEVTSSECGSGFDFIKTMDIIQQRIPSLNLIDNYCFDIRYVERIEYSESIVQTIKNITDSFNYTTICRCNEEDECQFWVSLCRLYSFGLVSNIKRLINCISTIKFINGDQVVIDRNEDKIKIITFSM
uniref:F-box/LRR-repeat protein n=1 Tax=Parastrongyloides trichosuri TaxID=131310 RepID=A0A0N4ZMB0_PARTI